MDRNTVDREGVRLSYLESGSGDPALLFIHGWCCDATHWRKQLAALDGDHRVLALDLRGHGESAKPDQDYTIDEFAEDMGWLCQELALERPVIVGHSMGGVIALNMVRRWPQLARAVVFVDAGITPFPKQFRPMVDSMIEALKSPGYRDVAANFVKRFIAARGKWEIYEGGQRRRLLIGIVSTPEDIAKNPQLRHRRWLTAVEHPELGETLQYPGPPYRLAETPWAVRRPPPLPGEHNAEVYGQLGVAPGELERLRAAGVL